MSVHISKFGFENGNKELTPDQRQVIDKINRLVGRLLSIGFVWLIALGTTLILMQDKFWPITLVLFFFIPLAGLPLYKRIKSLEKKLTALKKQRTD
ncbi:MAG: hypothetical protein EOO90_12665 [Pedobacter sp.]|nr:MAG: hypothetical protein EOO90_12665 [Pedobacter sp.]